MPKSLPKGNGSTQVASTARLKSGLYYDIARPGVMDSRPWQEGILMTGYCMRCRESRDIQDAQRVTMKNGRPATRGKCGITIFRIGAAS